MNPQADKVVRRTTMVATVTASYFLLTADYGPEPNALDPRARFQRKSAGCERSKNQDQEIKKTILSAQNSLKEFILGSRKEHQENSPSSSNAKEQP